MKSWGGPGTEDGPYKWPSSNHGITIDHMDNVWIGGNGPGDSHVLKFTKDGKFLAQYGKPDARKTGEKDGQPIYTRDSNAKDSFGRVAKIGIDPGANEAYIADGYFNRRVAVLDADTGAMKRYWGAFGNKPDDGDLPRYVDWRNTRSRPSAAQSTARRSRRTDWSTSATETPTASRSSAKTAPSSASTSSPRARCRRVRRGTSTSRTTRSSASSTWPTART